MLRKHTIKLLFICLLSYFSCSAFAFTLNSSEFFNQDMLPTINTCDGKDQSPDLNWDDAPAKTVSFAVIMSDLDAPLGVFYHWVVYNIPANINTLPSGITALPPGAALGKNSWGTLAYKGPCPPKDSSHRYVISIFALNTSLTLPENSDGMNVLDAMQDHVLGEADLKVNYAK